MPKQHMSLISLAAQSTCSVALCVLTAQALTHPAAAAGYGLRKASTVAMGAAYAGASATGTDATFLAYNPAATADVGHYDASISMIALLPHSSADYDLATTSAMTPAGGDMTQSEFVKTAYVPNFAARMRLSPELSAGLVVYAPWGLATGYDGGWAGRYYAHQTRLMTLNITPTLAYQVTDRISIAAGPQIQYAKGTLSNAIDIGTIGFLYSVPNSVPGAQDGDGTFRADDWGFGFVAGIMADVTDQLTVGLSYHSAVHHKLAGDLEFTLDNDGIGATLANAAGILIDTKATTRLTTPEKITFGARFALNDQWTAMFETDWTNWSRFKELRVVSANPFQPDDVTDADWEDSWFFAGGLEYAPDDRWTLRGGVALDKSPIPFSTRGPRIPDADRTWTSAGFSYRVYDNMDLSLSYAHMFLPEKSIVQTAAEPENALRGNLAGRTEAGANVFGVQLNYRIP